MFHLLHMPSGASHGSRLSRWPRASTRCGRDRSHTLLAFRTSLTMLTADAG